MAVMSGSWVWRLPDYKKPRTSPLRPKRQSTLISVDFEKYLLTVLGDLSTAWLHTSKPADYFMILLSLCYCLTWLNIDTWELIRQSLQVFFHFLKQSYLVTQILCHHALKFVLPAARSELLHEIDFKIKVLYEQIEPLGIFFLHYTNVVLKLFLQNRQPFTGPPVGNWNFHTKVNKIAYLLKSLDEFILYSVGKRYIGQWAGDPFSPHCDLLKSSFHPAVNSRFTNHWNVSDALNSR